MIEIPKIDLSRNDWLEVRNVLMKNIPEFEVWAFGSRVKWTAKAYSDLDLTVITEKPFTLEKLASIKDAFDESNLSIRIDIVDWAATSQSFQEIILKDKVVIQKAIKANDFSVWMPFRLSEIGRIVTGKTPLSNELLNIGFDVPFVTPPDFNGQKWIKQTSRAISSHGAESVKKALIPPNSVMVTCIGSDMGKTAISFQECVTNQQINSIIVNEKKFSPEFIYYNLSLRQQEIKNIAGGSAQPILNKTDFSDLWIDCPSLPTQKEIVSILNPLDDRIALLRETNTTLEAIAQALFKSWFVDFDPVHAKQQGREPEGMDANTAALFPDSFEESELGLVPMGWRVAKSGSTIDIRDGTHESPKEAASGYPFITTRHISSGKISFENSYLISKEDYINFSRRSKVDRFDILISMIGTVGIPVIVLKNETEFAVKNIGILKTSFEKKLSHFTYLLLKSTEIQQQIESRLAGTTQKYLSLSALRDIKFVMPDDLTLERFSHIVAVLFERINQNDEAIQTIANLRDTLLPRLISGQLRLPEPL